MERKYFFFDIDGTLAAGSADLPVAERVPASALKALAELRARGHFLALATGRLQVMAVDYLEQLGVVFGDARNDLSMFVPEWTSIAMGNAVPELKARATYVTDPVDRDGLYNACRHFGWI